MSDTEPADAVIDSADQVIQWVGESAMETQMMLDTWEWGDAARWVPGAATEPTEDGRCEQRDWLERHLGQVLADWQWERIRPVTQQVDAYVRALTWIRGGQVS